MANVANVVANLGNVNEGWSYVAIQMTSGNMGDVSANGHRIPDCEVFLRGSFFEISIIAAKMISFITKPDRDDKIFFQTQFYDLALGNKFEPENTNGKSLLSIVTINNIST